jgi:MFS family permease
MAAREPEDDVKRSRAIAAFTLGALFFGYAFTQRVAPSVMTTELMRDFAVGAAALGSLSAFYFYSYAAIQLPVGMLLDRFGPRKLMATALFLCSLASIGFGLSDTLATASFGRLLIGGTVAFGFVGTLTIAGYWFPPNRFVMLSGTLTTVGMLGGMLGQAPLRLAVEGIGWRGTVFVLAGVAAALAALIFLVVPHRSREQLKRTRNTNPFSGLRSVVVNPQSWYCAGVGFGPSATLLGFAGLWAVPWLSSVMRFPTAEAAGIASAVFLGWAVSAPAVGWLSDRMGRRKPLLYAGLTVNLLSLVAIVFGGTNDAFALSALFFANGASGCVMVIVFGSMRELNAPENNATALAMLNMFIVGAGAVMQPLVGWLLDINWQGGLSGGARVYGPEAYGAALLAVVAANALALICCFPLRETYCRPEGAKGA